MSQPLILTLQLNPEAQTFYEHLRRRYFPPERNLIPAHLTLLHQLPDEDDTRKTLREVAQATPAFLLTGPAPRSIGRGVAVFFQSEHLTALHAAILVAFQTHIIPQDRQRFQPHIVIQNKVDPDTARRTLPQLDAHTLIEPHGIGLNLWRYLGGPWERICDLPFADLVGQEVS